MSLISLRTTRQGPIGKAKCRPSDHLVRKHRPWAMLAAGQIQHREQTEHTTTHRFTLCLFDSLSFWNPTSYPLRSFFHDFPAAVAWVLPRFLPSLASWCAWSTPDPRGNCCVSTRAIRSFRNGDRKFDPPQRSQASHLYLWSWITCVRDCAQFSFTVCCGSWHGVFKV